jgi:hypothetical protein
VTWRPRLASLLRGLADLLDPLPTVELRLGLQRIARTAWGIETRRVRDQSRLDQIRRIAANLMPDVPGIPDNKTNPRSNHEHKPT